MCSQAEKVISIYCIFHNYNINNTVSPEQEEETKANPQSQLPAKITELRLPYGEKSQHYYKRVRATKRKNIGEERRNPHMLFTAVTFIALTALVAVIAWWRTRNDDLSTQDGYFLAGRSLTGPVIAGSLMLTNLSTEQLIGQTGRAFRPTWALSPRKLPRRQHSSFWRLYSCRAISRWD